MKRLKLILTMLTCLFCISLTVITTSALTWEGSSNGGGGNGTAATAKGFAIRDITKSVVIGYRFSVVDSNGNTVTEINALDIYRNATRMNDNYKFTNKYNKSKLIELQNNGFSTSKTAAFCRYQSYFSFSESLEKIDPDKMAAWATWESNLTPILNELGFVDGITSLTYGNKVLVEPIYDVKLEGIYHALTLTEIALYGKWYLGADSVGGNYDTVIGQSWGSISNYTNMHFANWLYTKDGMNLWKNASYLDDRASFNTLINTGYGVGIVYANTTPPKPQTITLCYHINGGTVANANYPSNEYGYISKKSENSIFFHKVEYGTAESPINYSSFVLAKINQLQTTLNILI